MKKLIQITLLGVLSLFTSAFAQVSISKWQSQPMAIDGNGSDWGMLPRFFNTDANVKYEFRNDVQNLYLIVKAADRATQMQLQRAGFSIKLKVKSTTLTKVSITFPALKGTEMTPILNNPEGRTDKLIDKSITKPEIILKDTVLLEGFLFTQGIISSENNDEKNISFARSKSNRELATYEIRIPLREIFGNGFKLETITSNPIQLQVIINDLSQNEMRKMKGRMGGGMHGGGRGMGEGMHGGGEMNRGNEIGGTEIGEMPGSEMTEMQSGTRGGFSMERKSFNIDFKLSTGK